VSRIAATGLLTLALVAGIAVPAIPCLADRLPRLVATGSAFGSLICHQRPDRSFTSCGRTWPVCGRCSGLYLGASAGALLVGLGLGRQRRRADAPPHVRTVGEWRRALLIAAAPTVLSWTLEAVTGLDPGTVARFVLALPLGLLTALWLAAVARGDLR